MSKLLASRGSQNVQCAEFTFEFDDTMLDTSGALQDFGKTNVASTVFEVVNLPPEAVVVGGDLITDTAFDAATYNVSVGDADSATRYLGATDKKGAGRTALVPTGFKSAGNLRITVVPADACTTGKMTLRVLFITPNRITEAYPS